MISISYGAYFRVARDSGTEWWRSSALATERPHLNRGCSQVEGSIAPLQLVHFRVSSADRDQDARHQLCC